MCVCTGLLATTVQMGWCPLTSGTCCIAVGWRDQSDKLVPNTLCKSHITQYPFPGKRLYPFQIFIEKYMGRLWVLWLFILNCK